VKRLPRCLAVAGALVASAAGAAADEPCFVLRDVTAETGVEWTNRAGSPTDKQYILEENGNGVALFDYDGDGDLDLFFVNGADLEVLAGAAPAPGSALYRNDGDWRFVEVTERAGVRGDGWAMGAAVGDIDGDGHLDLYVTRFGTNLLYRNRGDGTFDEIGERAGVADPGWGHSAVFADLDGDGDLDLYVTNYLVLDLATAPRKSCQYRGITVACGPVGFPPQADRLFWNDGSGRFVDGSAAAGIHAAEPQFAMGVVAVDFDDDGRIDLYVANDSGPNFLFHNLGGGRFEEVAWTAGVATQNEGRMQAGMGVEAGDVDGDGRVDLLVTNFALDHDTLHLNQGGDLFRDASYASGLGGASYPTMGWGVRLEDLDHDGDLDLYAARGHLYPEVESGGQERFAQPDLLALNAGDGRFAASPERIERPRGAAASRGVASGDLDGDGDVDLVVVELGERPTLLRNDQQACGGWLRVTLRGGRPTDGEGARALLVAGGREQRRDVTRSGSYLSSSDATLHFGIGAAPRVDRLELTWPDGTRQRYLAPPATRHLIVRPSPRSPRLSERVADGDAR
jgi:enediyne biosynthesis protein E4